MIGVSKDIDLNEVYDKHGNGSKTYEEFLIKANISHPDRIRDVYTIKDHFDKYDFNFLILIPRTNRFSSRHFMKPVYEIDVFRGTKSFERLVYYATSYFEIFIATGDTNPSLIIATRNGMVLLKRNSPTENLFGYISRNGIIGDVLYIVSVDTECRKPLLCMTSQYGCQVYSARTFGTVEAPNGLRPMWMHVHGFRTIAPARSIITFLLIRICLLLLLQ